MADERTQGVTEPGIEVTPGFPFGSDRFPSAFISSHQSLGGKRQAKTLLGKRDVIAVSDASSTVHVGVKKVTARRQVAASKRPHHHTVPAL